jgi:tetratricopeptide (TPR) repeat protein
VTLAAVALPDYPPATDGDIALTNHYSSLDRNWRVFRRWPDRPGTAEQIVDEEIRSAHFMGDATALDRVAELSSALLARLPQSASTHLIASEVASTRHHFAEAQKHLVEGGSLGAPQDDIARLRLTLDQARGENLPAVLDARRERAQASKAIQDLVPLGAVLADLGEFEEADQTYLHAIQSYRDLSPFPLAWTCFQLGTLWGETVPEPDLPRAASWYRQAIEYLPAYTHARVHLAEIHLDAGELKRAEALLRPIQESGDPEVKWRIAEVLAAQALDAEAGRELDAARESFETLLTRHELAFADHAAEFYLSTGDYAGRAFELAYVNWSNRPTLRAFELAHRAALASGETRLADELVIRARAKWCRTKAFLYSPLAERNSPALLADNRADT